MSSHDDSTLIQELFEALKQNGKVAYFNTSGSELTTRCPYCGDSRNNPNHGHMYISAVAPFSFFCQRCETKGFMHRETLRDFEVDNIELIQVIDRAAKHSIRNTTKTDRSISSLITNEKKILLPDYDEDSSRFKNKLKYLEGRFGVELSKRDLYNLKFVADINDVIELNRMTNLERFYQSSNYHQQLRSFLSRKSVGFQSMDTNFITFRHTVIPKNGRRYYTESMTRPVDIGNRLYTIRNKIDLLTPELNLIVAEGAFDIGSVYLNLYDRLRSPDTMFCGVAGKAYKMAFLLIRRMGFLKINLDLYSDGEIPKEYYKYTLNHDHFSSIRIHYNVYPGEKDFGVSKDKIKTKTYKLK